MITRKQFIKIMIGISEAELKYPIDFTDSKGEIVESKIDLWYGCLKNVIRPDLCDKLVEKILMNETEFPRIAKIREWAIGLDSTNPPPEIEARAEATRKKIREEREKEEQEFDCRTVTSFKAFYEKYPDLKAEVEKVKSDTRKCECGRDVRNGKVCLCIQRGKLRAKYGTGERVIRDAKH